MSQLAGSKPIAIAGRVADERERRLGMTTLERCWRYQWLQDQVLASNEPMYVRENWLERTNPIRRLWQINAPLPLWLGIKLGMVFFGVLCTHYYFKYNGNDWTKKGGWRIVQTRPMVLPGQPGFPFHPDRCEHGDYAERKFKSSPLYQND